MAVLCIKGVKCQIDNDMIDVLSQHKWRFDKDGYLMADVRNADLYCSIKMHRIVMNAPKGSEVDHINGLRHDNRRSNLRLCTRSENLRNVRKVRGISKYKGVSWCPRDNKWRSNIRINNKQKHLGRFETEQEAARAYDAAAVLYFGDFACPNQGLNHDHKTF